MPAIWPSIHLLATALMTGLIWFVQIVHYPLLARVGTPDFVTYEEAHCRRTSFVVGPLMIVEAVAALAVLVGAGSGLDRALAWTGLELLALIWLSTALIQVPLHRRLGKGFDPQTVRRLVASNWFRTIAWSIRSALAVALLAAA